MKEIIGGITTFLVLLPFLLVNRYIFKIKDQKKFIFFFFVINIIQIAFLVLLAYGLFFVGHNTLFGMLLIFTIFLFLNLFIFIRSKKNIKIEDEEDYYQEDEDDELFDEELFEDQRISRTQKVNSNIKNEIDELTNEQILEENQLTKKVDEIDFESLDKSEINKILEDIFKE